VTNIVTLKAVNAHRWAAMHVRANRMNQFHQVANRLIAPAAKARYQTVSSETDVPWFIIAVQHERESSQNWNTQLAQGDPLNRKSVHVPAGEGPYKTWEEGAIYALVHHHPWGVKPTDWSVGGMLTYLEGYNGPGYANRGLPSPYIWSGTDQYSSGKYVRDGVFDPHVVDVQLGCAGLLAVMAAIDQTIQIDEAVAA
jgi:lysozyme family protein